MHYKWIPTKMTFQVAKVNNIVGSVSQIVQRGNRAVFDAGGSYIQNLENGEKVWFRERNGVYVMDVWVAPPGSGFLATGVGWVLPGRVDD